MADDRQALDPALRALLDEQALHAPDLLRMGDAERTQAVRESLTRALAARESIAGLPNRVHTRDLTLSSGLRARLFTPDVPNGTKPTLLVYFHGGGWVAGSLETHAPFCCLLSKAAEVSILSVDYRQPPEHRFPAPLEDALSSVHWAAAHTEDMAVDPQGLAVGGDSAGANLAAAAVNRVLSEPNAPSLKAQLLLYPVTDHPSAHHPSYESNATGYGLTAEAMHWYWRQYAADTDPNHPDLSPLRREQLPTLPPTLVATAEYDVLRDEGRAYAEKLRDAGAAITHLHAPDMHHNSPVGPATVGRLPQCEETLSRIAGWLRAACRVPLPQTRTAESRG